MSPIQEGVLAHTDPSNPPMGTRADAGEDDHEDNEEGEDYSDDGDVGLGHDDNYRSKLVVKCQNN